MKPCSLRSVIGPIVNPLMVTMTGPAGTAVFVVMMMKSCLPRLVVSGTLTSLNAKEAAGAKHQVPVVHSLSEAALWSTCQHKMMRIIGYNECTWLGV